MKKILSSLMILFLLVIAACGCPYTSTTSYLYVVEKGYSEDYREAWIIAFDPNNETNQENVMIIVEEPMVWNLIEVNKTYFTGYSKEKDDDWILDQIGHDDTLR
ncbi:hypothetical protein JSQ81_05400 [Sporosarcina sp. Marseille-Q4063]|uniref:hypothetical protein n=1 Tax=Sporosarcina sp. Marseille-Q4063 TaxID=2810514 RepID=UPI001BAEE2AC|nr:hypothetical protein [Sporosarcina sp. Marseille-Q4063]QUW23007.1 hypothetical protein JSQ81_05400 [Sporosarcina sp. Marseille-Q4063]